VRIRAVESVCSQRELRFRVGLQSPLMERSYVIDLEYLLRKFKPNEDYELDGARHNTHTPWRGRLAYLNIIFRPADSEVQEQKIDPVGLPDQVRDFYHRYNGAHLFNGCFSIYGFFPFVHLYDRKNFRKSYPFNIERGNEQCGIAIKDSPIVLVGSYEGDRSGVVVDKKTGVVRCSVGEDLSAIRTVWPSFESWLEEEIERLSEYFDEYGNQLVDSVPVLPGRTYRGR